MFLTEPEIKLLTGRMRHGSQAAALRSMGIEFRQRPDGSLAVLRLHVQDMLGAGGHISDFDKSPEPDWSVLDGAA